MVLLSPCSALHRSMTTSHHAITIQSSAQPSTHSTATPQHWAAVQETSKALLEKDPTMSSTHARTTRYTSASNCSWLLTLPLCSHTGCMGNALHFKVIKIFRLPQMSAVGHPCWSRPEHVEGTSSLPVIYGEGPVSGAHTQDPPIAAESHALHNANLGKHLLCFACSASTALCLSRIPSLPALCPGAFTSLQCWHGAPESHIPCSTHGRLR